MLTTTPAQHNSRESPAPPLTERALGSAADQLEGALEGRERLPLLASGAEDRAPPDEEAAQRDDERGDSSVGDDVARHRADQGAEHDAHDQRDHPHVRLVREPADRDVETEEGDDAVGLYQGHRVAEESEQRTHGQVDVARHDDQDHARGHDRDRRALDREVPEVSGREEVAVRQGVERDPDGRDGHHHAEQTGVQLGRGQQRAPAAFARWVRVMEGSGWSRAPSERQSLSTSTLVDTDQQTGTEPAVTPLHTLSLVVQPASMTTLRLSLVMGCGLSRIDVSLLPPGLVERGGAADLRDVLVLAQLRRPPRRRSCPAGERPSRRRRSACRARPG